MTWTRRSVLRALGASAAAMTPLVQACIKPSPNVRDPHPGRRAPASPSLVEPRSIAALRAQLRGVVAELSQRFGHASALASVARLGRVTADAGEYGGHQDLATAVVLEVASGARHFEHATTDVSAAGIDQAAALLRAQASAGYQSIRPPMPLASPRHFAVKPATDPRTAPLGQWIERVRELHERARRFGGSRIVYRGAYALIDDRDVLYIGNGRDLMQRLVRARAGVVLVAQRGDRHGSMPVAELAEQSGLMGLEATDVPAVRLEAAADRVLALVTPAAPPAGDTEVILGPGLSAAMAHHCVAEALLAQHWLSGVSRAAALHGRRVGSALVSIIDDPGVAAPGVAAPGVAAPGVAAPGVAAPSAERGAEPGAAAAYGSYFFDDQGELARSSTLVDQGILAQPISDRHSAALLDVPRTANGRRATPTGAILPRPSNIRLAPGTASAGELIQSVKRGLLLDGHASARTEPRTWRFVARAARAYEIVDGKLSGVLYGNVDVRGDVPALLQAVQGVSSEAEISATGDPVASSMGGPHVLTRVDVVT